MVIYRYSGSVYQVAISAEAFYLVLLLLFPYYSEKKGCRFCIIASWGNYNSYAIKDIKFVDKVIVKSIYR